jgi:thymidine phosphorylase
VTVALGAEMLRLAGLPGDEAALRGALADGTALARYRAMIAAQGGDPDAPLPRAAHTRTVAADRDGFVQRLDAYAVGVAAWRLGAGRARKEDPVSASAGVICRVKPGEQVEAGQPVLELLADDEARFGPATAALAGMITIGPEPPEPQPLVLERIETGSKGTEAAV